MAGLVGYESSDEESDQDKGRADAPVKQPSPQASQQTQPTLPEIKKPPPTSSAGEPRSSEPEVQLLAPPQDAPQQGPAPPTAEHDTPLGPSLPPVDETTILQATSEQISGGGEDGAPPSSPYTTARSLIHDLTLPTIPNFDIPASPPGSPAPGTAATSQKFARFLDLKKNGTHFNARLEQSLPLRNPALMDKLLLFVDMPPPGSRGSTSSSSSSSQSAKSMQYHTTLSPEVWDPAAFPDWAFRDRLRQTRDKMAKEREAVRAASGRSSVQFVSATGSTGTAAPSGGLSTAKGDKKGSGWQ